MTNRRSFLSAAGGSARAAAVFLLAQEQSRPQAPRTAPNDQIGVGYIGSGIRGTQLIEDFKRVEGLRHVAVCDLYDGCLARAKEQIGDEIATTKDYRAVLDRKDIEAVVIATPDHWHRRMVLDALSARKHVYIEKPLTWALEEGPEIIAAEKASRKVLQVGSQGKTSALTAKAREIVHSGVLGRITMVRMANHRNNAQGAWRYEVPPDASEQTVDWAKFLGDRKKRPFDARTFFQWRCWWEFSGGVATDLFVHMLTWLHEVMGAQAPVSALTQGGLYCWQDGRDVPDVMNTLLEYEEGFVADLYVHLANSFRPPGWTIMGTLGTLVDEGNRLILYPEPADLGVQGYGTLQWPKQMRAAYFESKGWRADGRPREPLPKPKEAEEIRVERGPSHAALFIESVRDGKPSRENATEGHCAAGAAHIANLAYQRGRKLRWDWRTNRVIG